MGLNEHIQQIVVCRGFNKCHVSIDYIVDGERLRNDLESFESAAAAETYANELSEKLDVNIVFENVD